MMAKPKQPKDNYDAQVDRAKRKAQDAALKKLAKATGQFESAAANMRAALEELRDAMSGER